MNNDYATPPPPGAVVVGVGLDGADAALAFAAEEACRTRSPLHVLHVLRVSATEAYSGVYQGAVEVAGATLDQAVTHAHELVAGRVPVTAQIIDDGRLVTRLADDPSRSRMLVLQHRRLGRLHRLVTGSTVSGVAARCVVPVVSVPEDWRPETARDAAPDLTALVTVGVQDAVEAVGLVRRAVEEAASLGGRVEVLHAWWLYGGYDVVVDDRELRSTRERELTAVLGPALEAARAEHPDVPVRVHVRHAPPVDALLAAAEASRQLILGRRHHLLPFGSHLGPVVSTVLRDSPVPVLLEPETPLPERVRDTRAVLVGAAQPA